MTEILSQEEIDALLRGGVAQQAPKEEPQSDTGSAAESQASPFPKEHPQTSQTQEKAKSRSKMKHSSVLEDQVYVRPATFETFEDEPPSETTNMEVVLNLDLEIRVELGQTTRTVREILEMGPGSVIELQRYNGEPVDLLVNQKPFARGEMIVITGENFGVRVTDISSVKEIIEALR